MSFHSLHDPNVCLRCGKPCCFSSWGTFADCKNICTCRLPSVQGTSSADVRMAFLFPDKRLAPSWLVAVSCPKCKCKVEVHCSDLTLVYSFGFKTAWLFRCTDCSHKKAVMGRVIVLDDQGTIETGSRYRYYSRLWSIDLSRHTGLGEAELTLVLCREVEEFFNTTPKPETSQASIPSGLEFLA